MSTTPGVYIDQSWAIHIIDIIKGVIVEIIGNEVTNNDPPQETWGAPLPGNTPVDQMALSQFWFDLNQGSLALTDYNDIRMDSIGDGWWQSSYVNLDSGELSMFVAEDRDGNGAVDHVYQRDNDGNWWVATHTDSEGKPIWQPSDEPKKTPKTVGG